MTETRILQFGQSAGKSGGLIMAEIDQEVHGDAGSVFAPGTKVYFLLHLGDNLRVRSIRDTAGGTIEKLGEVVRGHSEEVLFSFSGESQDIPHVPDAIPAVRWYGRSAGLVWSPGSSALAADAAPVLGVVNYSYVATQYRYTPPPMDLEGDEEFPVEIVLETEEV